MFSLADQPMLELYNRDFVPCQHGKYASLVGQRLPTNNASRAGNIERGFFVL
jgi:hypothetical protein